MRRWWRGWWLLLMLMLLFLISKPFQRLRCGVGGNSSELGEAARRPMSVSHALQMCPRKTILLLLLLLLRLHWCCGWRWYRR